MTATSIVITRMRRRHRGPANALAVMIVPAQSGEDIEHDEVAHVARPELPGVGGEQLERRRRRGCRRWRCRRRRRQCARCPSAVRRPRPGRPCRTRTRISSARPSVKSTAVSGDHQWPAMSGPGSGTEPDAEGPVRAVQRAGGEREHEDEGGQAGRERMRGEQPALLRGAGRTPFAAEAAPAVGRPAAWSRSRGSPICAATAGNRAR